MIANGTYINGKQVKKNEIIVLNSSSKLQFGKHEDIFVLHQNEEFSLPKRQRSRSRSSEGKEEIKVVKHKHQPWNQLNINSEEKLRFMKLMGVKVQM